MNTADKKRIEQMLSERTRKAIGYDRYGNPQRSDARINLPKPLQTKLNNAFKALRPTNAAFDRCAKVVKEIEDLGFNTDWDRKQAERWSSSAPAVSVTERNEAYKVQQQEKRDHHTAVNLAYEQSVIALWSNDEFDINVYFERIDTAG